MDPVTQTRKVLKYDYEGSYSEDKKCGYGLFLWPSGSRYEGNFSEDFRDGFGIMHWADGTTYEGEWVKGVQSGKGKLKLPDGTIKIGIFKDNLIVEEHHSEMPAYAVQLL